MLKAQSRSNLVLYETHHIIPRCLKGNDSAENLVRLTPREHFIAHHLLTKMIDSYKINLAFCMMLCNNPNQQRGYIITSRTYEKLKILNSRSARERNLKREYSNNFKLWYNPETDHIIRLAQNELPPTGYQPGRRPSQQKSNSNKGRKYYNNPTTGEVKKFKHISEVPPGCASDRS